MRAGAHCAGGRLAAPACAPGPGRGLCPSGAARFRLGDRDLHPRVGDCLLVPKGSPHSYLVTSAEGVRFLTITRGRDLFDFVREVGRPAPRDGLPDLSGPPTEEERDALVRIAEKYGIEFVGPPLH